MTRKLIRISAAVLTTILALVLLWQFRLVVIYALISLMLAAALRPLVTRLAGKRFLVRLAWILLYLVILAGFGILLFLTAETAVIEIQQLSKTLSVQDKWVLPAWLEGTSFQQILNGRLPPPSKLFLAVTGDKGQLVLPAILGFTQGMGSVISAVMVILFLSIYWTINQVHFERLWLSLLPSDMRKKARGAWRTIEPDIGAYIRGEVAHSLLAGLILGVVYALLGSPYPAFLALAGAVACLVPVVGVALVIIPVLLVGLLTSLQLGILTATFALVIFISLEIWVKKRLFKRRWDNPILTIFLLIVLADAFGIAGIIVAPPLSVIFQILWSRLVIRRTGTGAAAQVSDLKERQTQLWNTINAMEEPPLHLVTSSMQRLAALIEKAEPILKAAEPVESPEPLVLVPPQSGLE
jgi:putative permease